MNRQYYKHPFTNINGMCNAIDDYEEYELSKEWLAIQKEIGFS
jgi:hypothetical protein